MGRRDSGTKSRKTASHRSPEVVGIKRISPGSTQVYHMLNAALALTCCKLLVGEGVGRRHLDRYEFMLGRQGAGIAGSGERGIGAGEVRRVLARYGCI